MAARDPEAVTALYSRRAILTGAGAASVRIGSAEIARHFGDWFNLAPVVEAFRAVPTVTMVSCEAAEIRGILPTVFDAGDVRERRVSLRFSLHLRRDGDRWSIVHHHATLPPGSEYEADARRAGEAQSIETGTIARRMAQVLVPPPPFALPATPPVLVAEVNRGLLAAARTGRVAVVAPVIAQNSEIPVLPALPTPRPIPDVVVPVIATPVIAMPASRGDVVLPPSPFSPVIGPPAVPPGPGVHQQRAIADVQAIDLEAEPESRQSSAGRRHGPALDVTLPTATVAAVANRFADISRFLGAMFDPPLKAVAGFAQRSEPLSPRPVTQPAAAERPPATVPKRAAPTPKKVRSVGPAPVIPPAPAPVPANPLREWQGNGPG